MGRAPAMCDSALWPFRSHAAAWIAAVELGFMLVLLPLIIKHNWVFWRSDCPCLCPIFPFKLLSLCSRHFIWAQDFSTSACFPPDTINLYYSGERNSFQSFYWIPVRGSTAWPEKDLDTEEIPWSLLLEVKKEMGAGSQDADTDKYSLFSWLWISRAQIPVSALLWVSRKLLAFPSPSYVGAVLQGADEASLCMLPLYIVLLSLSQNYWHLQPPLSFIFLSGSLGLFITPLLFPVCYLVFLLSHWLILFGLVLLDLVILVLGSGLSGMQEVLPAPRQEEPEVKYQVMTWFWSDAQSSHLNSYLNSKEVQSIQHLFPAWPKMCVLEPCKSGPLPVVCK